MHRAGACTADLLTATRAQQNCQTATTAAVEVLASMGTAGWFFPHLAGAGAELLMRKGGIAWWFLYREVILAL
jgi:hypothetical protein